MALTSDKAPPTDIDLEAKSELHEKTPENRRLLEVEQAARREETVCSLDRRRLTTRNRLKRRNESG